jgi:hypothetical protein
MPPLPCAAPQTRIDLLNQVAMFGCLTEEHKQLLASALEQVGRVGLGGGGMGRGAAGGNRGKREQGSGGGW